MNTITIKKERLLELICEVLYEEGELGQEAEFPEEMIDSAANELLHLLEPELATLEEQEGTEDAQEKIANSLEIVSSNIPKENKEEFEELVLFRAQQKAKRLKLFALAALFGSFMAAAGIGLDYQRQAHLDARLEPYHRVVGAQETSRAIRGGYEGPPLSMQDEYYKKLDFTGDIGDLHYLPKDSTAMRIAKYKRAPTEFYISPDALLDKPMPKLKSATGQKALDYYNYKLDAHEDKVFYLLTVFDEFSSIGQVGVGGSAMVQIPVKDGDSKVIVQPPEFSILLYFLTEAVNSLTEEEQNEFFSKVDIRETRKYYMTDKGKYYAIKYGYDLGKEGKEIDKDSNAYKYAQTLVDLGYKAGKNGKSMPPVPSRGI